MSLFSAFVQDVLESRAPVLTRPDDYEFTRKVLREFRKAWDPVLIEHLDGIVPGLVFGTFHRFKLDLGNLIPRLEDLRSHARTETFLASLSSTSKRFKAREVCLFDLALIALKFESDISSEERLAALACLFDPVNAIFSADYEQQRRSALTYVDQYAKSLRV